MATFPCKDCGEEVIYQPGDRTATCMACGKEQTVPAAGEAAKTKTVEAPESVKRAPAPDEAGSTIFSQHKSSVEVAQEKREAKQAAKEARRVARAEKKTQPRVKDPSTRVTVMALLILGAVIVLGIVLMVVNQMRGQAREERAGSGHFYSNDQPELSTEGIKGVISEAYYTNDGALALKLTLSNGLSAEHYLTSLEVVVKNGEEETIATGYTDAIPDGYCIEAQGYNTFLFYINKEYVKIADDDLDEISYEINTEGEIDSAALPSDTTGTAGTTTSDAA